MSQLRFIERAELNTKKINVWAFGLHKNYFAVAELSGAKHRQDCLQSPSS